MNAGSPQTEVEIRVAHSPDSDDAFMFYALAAEKLDTKPFRFVHTLEDIETLNRKALKGFYEVSAVSIHAYAYITDLYLLLPSGASMGDRYGPLLIARRPMAEAELRGKRIGIPGKMTTAYLALRLYHSDFEPVIFPFDRIMDAVAAGEVDAGLLIHEGQLTYASQGFHKIVDLGEWWHQETGLPLPLGGNVIRRDLGQEWIVKISRLLRESIQYALDHREEALTHAMQYARDLHKDQADTFVGMYVNSRTLDYGEEGRQAVRLLLERAHAQKLIPARARVEFTD